MSHFLSLLGPFLAPKTNHFRPGFQFYLSYLNILYIFIIFRDFFSNLVFKFHSIPVA